MIRSHNSAKMASVAALLMAASWQAHSATPMTATVVVAETPTGENGPISREQVREELARWRAAGLLDQPGEAGATAEVLAARDDYNQRMGEVIVARLQQEQERLAAAEAERFAAAQRAAEAQRAEAEARRLAELQRLHPAYAAPDGAALPSMAAATETDPSPLSDQAIEADAFDDLGLSDNEVLIDGDGPAPIGSTPAAPKVPATPATSVDLAGPAARREVSP